jgi:predicted RNA-binding protein YlxR (DUF448 family)
VGQGRDHPERTCVGCAAKGRPDRLARLRVEETSVIVDHERQGGRGAWIHPTAECLDRALRRRAFARAFRRSDLAWDEAALRAELTGNARKD